MSSEPTFKLLNLASEIVAQVIAEVSDKKDLANLRLTCKTLEPYPRKELFKNVFVSPSKRHLPKWNSITQSDRIRCIPRETTIQTRPDDEREEYNEKDFQKAIAALSKFPNIDSLQIHFSYECRGSESDREWPILEETWQRKDMFERIFRAIKDRAADKNNRTIRKLTIENLQNYPHKDFTSSGLFHDVMCDLEELHLSTTQEYDEHVAELDCTRIELRTFPEHLCSAWLAPIASNLTTLSLYSYGDNWGCFPGYFDPSGISFPKLETLALGYYTLAHNNDIDWILNIQSLRKLILHNCMIVSSMYIFRKDLETWNVPIHDWDLRFKDSFRYKGVWSMFLDRISESLPNLSHFAFDYNGGSAYNMSARDACRARIFVQRYIGYSMATLPTPWPKPDEEGESWEEDGIEINPHKDNFDVDQESLRKLLSRLKRCGQ
ncbi:hypothetical protein DM02DRAFT_585840 [Periconia macrospinosa]|uniref:F-box domain-containing protein n=1 Tax=Periconia macrospinosa TaxID=97972 RepID=A0A2V1E1W1_9PLEO|nr:hypothetical protein DM02DRAFT_585840 [Periconia macrospinosa]